MASASDPSTGVIRDSDGTTYHVISAAELEAMAESGQQIQYVTAGPAAAKSGSDIRMVSFSADDPDRVDSLQRLANFWPNVDSEVDNLDASSFKDPPIPLARIKKIMKMDEDVKMISAEVPLLFSKACELFIKELTLRSWTCTETTKRRTMQRSDVTLAAAKCDMFDFLIDILPRGEDVKGVKTGATPSEKGEKPPAASASGEQSFCYSTADGVGGRQATQKFITTSSSGEVDVSALTDEQLQAIQAQLGSVPAGQSFQITTVDGQTLLLHTEGGGGSS